MPEVFTNLGLTTVSSGGTTAPAPGTVENWTVASSASFPTAATGGNQFRVVEDDAVKQSEIILVTNVSGTTWTVTRGAEGTTPVAHTAGFTIVQVISKAVMDNWLQLDNAQTITGAKTFTGTTVWNGTNIQLIGGTGSISLAGTLSAVGAIATLSSVQANAASSASAGTPTVASGSFTLTPRYWNGSASVDDPVTLQATATTAGVTTLAATADLMTVASKGVVTSSTTTANKLTVAPNASPPSSPATGDLWIVSDQTGSVTDASLPRGYVNQITPVTANQTTITTIVDVTGSSMTVTLVAGRRYRFTAQGLGCLSTVATDVYQVGLSLGGTQYALARATCGSTTQANESFCIVFPVQCVSSGATAPGSINAGSTTCKLTVARSVGTGTLTLTNAAPAPLTFIVEDIGGT